MSQCVLVGHYLSLRAPGEVLELVYGFIVNWQVVHPEEHLLLGIVSRSCHEDVICLSWNSSHSLQSDRKENDSEQG
jgi:hypothetical protein